MRNQIDELSRREGYRLSRLPYFTKNWIHLIRGSSDFFAISYMTSRIVYSVADPLPVTPLSIWPSDTYLNYTVSPDWTVETGVYYYDVPSGLGDVLRWFISEMQFHKRTIQYTTHTFRRYIARNFDNPPVLIVRNGFADSGELNDSRRIAFLRAHLQQILDSICNFGSRVFGILGEIWVYLWENVSSIHSYSLSVVWSLYNSFEYREGYT